MQLQQSFEIVNYIRVECICFAVILRHFFHFLTFYYIFYNFISITFYYTIIYIFIYYTNKKCLWCIKFAILPFDWHENRDDEESNLKWEYWLSYWQDKYLKCLWMTPNIVIWFNSYQISSGSLIPLKSTNEYYIK